MLSQLKHNGFFSLFFVNRIPHIFPQKKHQKIEIITAIVTQTWQLCIWQYQRMHKC